MSEHIVNHDWALETSGKTRISHLIEHNITYATEYIIIEKKAVNWTKRIIGAPIPFTYFSINIIQ